MAISSLGIGSGLNAGSIVSQLVALERKPIENLQTAATAIQTQISSLGKVQSLMSTMRDAASALAKPTLWSQTTAATADSSAVSATTTGSVAPGEYSVSVTKLARAQTLYSPSLSSSSAVVGSGTMSIQLVSDYGPPAVPKTGASALNLDFTDPNTTLTDVSKAINAANAGVSATVVRDPSGTARLALSSSATGADNQIMVSTTGTGFADFAYDGVTPTAMTQAQAAQNAQLTLNGVPVESSTNQVSDAIDGLALTLSKESATPVKITVASDESAQKKAVEDFVAAYNALNSYFAEQTKYDETSKKAGPLQGDTSVQGLRNQLRSIVQGIGGTSSTYNTLSSAGLEMQKDGSLTANSTKLNAALKKPAELSKLFANLDSGTPSNNGFGVSLRQFVDRVTGIDGVVTTRTSNLQGKLKRNQTEQDRQEDRVARVQARLEKQYQTLDTKMSSLNALSTYVSQQVTNWNNSSSDS